MIVADVIFVVLALAIIAALTYKYVTTRDIGFVWLAIAMLVWPFGAATFRAPLVAHWIRGGHVDLGVAYTEVTMAARLIGLVLQLIAVLYLYRKVPLKVMD